MANVENVYYPELPNKDLSKDESSVESQPDDDLSPLERKTMCEELSSDLDGQVVTNIFPQLIGDLSIGAYFLSWHFFILSPLSTG